jgi:hypothetical protein
LKNCASPSFIWKVITIIWCMREYQIVLSKSSRSVRYDEEIIVRSRVMLSICDLGDNCFRIFDLEIGQAYISDWLWSENDHYILLDEEANVRDIGHRLQTQFEEQVYRPWTVQVRITEVWLGRQDLHNEIRTERPLLNDLETKILGTWDKSLFESARSIDETLRVDHWTVLLHLHDSIGFRLFHLDWVLHLLMHDLREKQRKYAKVILPSLHATERNGWHDLMTGDES